MKNLDLGQLRALAATVAEGSLDGAARALHVTPSAVSQRLKALEHQAGAVLLVRGKPVRITETGQVLLRLARQIEVLTADAEQSLGAGDSRPVLPLAINADSLATWVLPALAPLAHRFTFDLHREDQAHTRELLRSGTVTAAITSHAEPVPGCRVIPLGGMRYRPMATDEFARRHFPSGPTAGALRTAPVVVYDRKDDLQADYLRRRRVQAPGPPLHFVPSSADYLRAVTLGFGWGMLPDQQVSQAERSGEVAVIDPRGSTIVRLYWQQWQLESLALQEVADAVAQAARTALSHPR